MEPGHERPLLGNGARIGDLPPSRPPSKNDLESLFSKKQKARTVGGLLDKVLALAMRLYGFPLSRRIGF